MAIEITHNPKACAACGVLHDEKGELYFNRTSVLAKGNEAPMVVLTCHKCLQEFYGTIVPDLIRLYKNEGEKQICLLTAAKSSMGIKREPTFSRLLRYLKLRG